MTVTARYVVRMREMAESVKIIRQALKDMPSGDVLLKKVPRKAPAKEVYAHTEDPRGEAGMYIIGNGTDRPYRVKIRSPAFVNISALPHFVIGYRVADVPTIAGSIDICMGEADR